MNPIVDLESKTTAVAQQHVDYEQAHEDAVAAEVALVQRVLEIVRPSLSALCSFPEVGHTYTVDGGDLKVRRASWRGLLLRGTASAEKDHPRDDRGNYTGVGWFVLPNLMLRRVDYGGAWTRWQGGLCCATSTEHTVTLADLMEWEDAEMVVARIVAALDAQLTGNKARQTKAALARAEKLRAVSALLEGGK